MQIKDIFTKDISSKSITGLTDSKTYYFNVIVRDESGNKSAYTKMSATTTDATGPVPGNGTGIQSAIHRDAALTGGTDGPEDRDATSTTVGDLWATAAVDRLRRRPRGWPAGP